MKRFIFSIGLLIVVASMGTWYMNTVSTEDVVYRNNTYRFLVDLPENWRGYSISLDQWTGDAINDQLGEKPYTTGPVVSIHNPKWTKEILYQDIPVMVFTLAQWDDLQAEKFHIGAAPINPSELARNAQYVFALPARYNFAYPPGYEEVEAILATKPVHAF